MARRPSCHDPLHDGQPESPKTTETIMNPQTGPRKLAITSES